MPSIVEISIHLRKYDNVSFGNVARARVRAASRFVSTLDFGTGLNSQISVETSLDAARTSARATIH